MREEYLESLVDQIDLEISRRIGDNPDWLDYELIANLIIEEILTDEEEKYFLRKRFADIAAVLKNIPDSEVDLDKLLEAGDLLCDNDDEDFDELPF